MAFRITYHEATIEVESIAEFRSVIDVLGLSPAQPPLALAAPSDGGTLNARIRTLWRGLTGNQRILIDLLRVNNWVTDDRLRAALRLKSNNALAGVVAGVVKNAKKHDIDSIHIFEKGNYGANGSSYSYRATDQLKAAVEDTGMAEIDP